MAIIEELFEDQRLRNLEDRIHNAKIKLIELSGQSEFHKAQLNLQQAELEKVESAGNVLAAEIKIISAEVRLIRTQSEAREIMGQVTQQM